MKNVINCNFFSNEFGWFGFLWDKLDIINNFISAHKPAHN